MEIKVVWLYVLGINKQRNTLKLFCEHLLAVVFIWNHKSIVIYAICFYWISTVLYVEVIIIKYSILQGLTAYLTDT